MLHPAFEPVPDRTMAEACSQSLIEAGAFKFATPELTVEQYGPGFPPVPTEIVSVIATYLEDGSDGPVGRTRFASLSANMPTAGEIADLYDITVGGFQSHIPEIERTLRALPEFAGEEDVTSWCVATAQRAGKRLLAAHFVGRTVADDVLIDALVYPTEIMQNLPLIIRNAVVEINPLLSADAEALGIDPQRLSVLREGVKPLLRGDSSMANFSAVAVSRLLPEAPRFRAILESQLP